MPKKPNHTKCRKTTIAGHSRKYRLRDLLIRGKIKLDRFWYYKNLPLKTYMSLRKQGKA
jgi:hypothetical protein